METRLSFFEKGQNAVKPLFNLNGYIKKSTLGRQLVELIDFRISQINGCAYCLDMHSKELRAMGETEQRLYGLSAWREAPYYTDRERAAFAWAEAVNALHVTDEVYREVASQFTEEEIVDLTMVVSAIRSWNSINIAFPAAIGTYRVGQFG
ncbi:carboxymuconolactone decarboxylase family protein [Dyadobacter sp. BHUBP1]|uniref:carboxymuconolactone decarboxylase family protein n=1 Tax=Dyadobacter sp. BHUBP1 TaxID=3424178 RepID=UPI003D353B1C